MASNTNGPDSVACIFLESRRAVGMSNATSAIDDQGVAFATPLAGPGGPAVGPPETGGEVILFDEAVHSEAPIQY